MYGTRLEAAARISLPAAQTTTTSSISIPELTYLCSPIKKTMKLFHLTSVLLQIFIRCAAARLTFNRNEWMSIAPNVDFQRNDDVIAMNSELLKHAADEAINRMLSSSRTTMSEAGKSSKEANPSYMYQPIDSSASYSEYQLAWYLLGYYVDCGTANNYGSGCVRQVLYAVYAYPDYAGGGIGEYSYYDTTTNKWTCYSGNCKAKMDCHLSDTKWKLIGVFKINNISGNNGFMELLLKHEGACLWGDDTYKVAYKMKDKVPEGCKATKKTLADGSTLYYGAKPEADGNISLGLYTDNMCSKEYVGKTTYDVFSLVGSDNSYWVSFNEALDVYKQCQPCVSYDLSSSDFECYDKAGYTNVNQCMKFAAKAGSKTASTGDVMLAARQNTLVPFVGFGEDYENSVFKAQEAAMQQGRNMLLVSSIVFCALGLVALVLTHKVKRQKGDEMSLSLVDKTSKDGPNFLHRISNSYQNMASKVKMASLSTAKSTDTHAETEDEVDPLDNPISLQPPPADSLSGKSHSSSLSKLGSKVLKKISKSLSYKDSVSEKVNLEVKYVEKSSESQYIPPVPPLSENDDTVTRHEEDDLTRHVTDSNANGSSLNAKQSDNSFPVDESSAVDQTQVLRQINSQDGPHETTIPKTADFLYTDTSNANQTLDLQTANMHNESTLPSNTEQVNKSDAKLSHLTHSPLEEEKVPRIEGSSDIHSGESSKKSKSLKQYLKKFKLT